VSIGFTSDNIEDTRSSLEKLSIAVTERSEEGGQFLHFADPDGTALYFIKSKWDRHSLNKFSIDHYFVDQIRSKRVWEICQ